MKIEKEQRDPRTGLWLLAGLGIGAIIGYLTDSLYLWLGVGMAVGLIIGAIVTRDR